MPASRAFTRRWLAATVLAGALAASGAAQARDLPDETGTGGGPRSTVTAPNTSAVGRVMPHPGGADVRLERRIDARTRLERADDRIEDGICVGCGG